MAGRAGATGKRREERTMGVREDRAFAIGDILDKLERSAREVGRSLDHKNQLDLDRLRRVRANLVATLNELDALISGAERES